MLVQGRVFKPDRNNIPMAMQDEVSRAVKGRAGDKANFCSSAMRYKAGRDRIGGQEEIRERVRKIKEESLGSLDSLLGRAVKSLEGNGIRVFQAKTGEEAVKKILEIIGRDRHIAKSKSNTCREIGLTEKLERAGKSVRETDLGDFILQISGGAHIHPLRPALALSAGGISEIVRKEFKKNISGEQELLEFLEGRIRQDILRADVGITGANAITSDGSIVLVENEGNISLITRLPKRHIILAGIEKVLSKPEDSMAVVKAATVFGSGREQPVYVNIISSPSETGDIGGRVLRGAQGAREVYLILLDNGRRELIKEGLGEILWCLNCGACINFCPPFHQLLEYFGDKYPGPRGIIASGHEGGKSKAYLCTDCRACWQNCPAGIDLPELLRKVRKSVVKKGIELPSNERMIANIREFGNPFGEVQEGKIPKELYCC